MCAGSRDPVTAVFVAVDENVTQVIVQAELEQDIAGTGNRPTVFVMMIYDQTVSHGTVPEFPVVICPTSGTVLDSQNIITEADTDL